MTVVPNAVSSGSRSTSVGAEFGEADGVAVASAAARTAPVASAAGELEEAANHPEGGMPGAPSFMRKVLGPPADGDISTGPAGVGVAADAWGGEEGPAAASTTGGDPVETAVAGNAAAPDAGAAPDVGAAGAQGGVAGAAEAAGGAALVGAGAGVSVTTSSPGSTAADGVAAGAARAASRIAPRAPMVADGPTGGPS